VTPHLVLLTATPMQVQPAEYHGLLRLLGLDATWSSFDDYQTSLNLLSSEFNTPGLQDAMTLGQLITASTNTYQWIPALLSEREIEKIRTLCDFPTASKVEMSIFVQNNFPEFRRILMKIHPAHLLTCRNTKSGLEKFGYRFPERIFESPEVFMTGGLREFENAVEQYLTNGYGQVEASLNPDSKSSVGFAKSGYYQRMVSSFFAAQKSLESRKAKIGRLLLDIEMGNYSSLEAFFAADPNSDDIDDEEFDIQNPQHELDIERIIVKVKSAVKLETSYINDVLKILLSAGADVTESDPKFKAAMEILSTEIQDSQVLVFSRYTDTLDGFTRLFEASGLQSQVAGYARYTGGEVWIESGGRRRESNKQGVTDALRSGEVTVVFCSDAASEGLNLQSARCLINLDVPWNPARLEQRIGRIARLGQISERVKIVNLWYPKSIEAKMYARLLSRRDEYQLAVGEFPEIFGQAIRDEVALTLGSGHGAGGDPITELQQMRNDIQRIALESVWGQLGSELPPSESFRQGLANFVEQCKIVHSVGEYKNAYLVQAGQKGSLTLLHAVLDEAAGRSRLKQPVDSVRLFAIESGNVNWGFALEVAPKGLRVLRVTALPKLLCGTLTEVQFDENDFIGELISFDSPLEALTRSREESLWIPKHESARIPSEANSKVHDPDSYFDAQFTELGWIGVHE
jgi:hypothetical protein